jgi:hypothetical protein
MMMEWHPAPDLEPDLVNGLADCEGFFIARTPIKCGDELLWHYPVHNVKKIRLIHAVDDVVAGCGNSAEDGVDDCVMAVDVPEDLPTGTVNAGGYAEMPPHHAVDGIVLGHSAQIQVHAPEDLPTGSAQMPVHVPVNAVGVAPAMTALGDESDEDEGGFQHAPQDAFEIGDFCNVIASKFGPGTVTGKVTGRIISRSTRNVMKYVVSAKGNSVVVPCRNIVESFGGEMLLCQESADQDDIECDANGAGDDLGIENESGRLAKELSGDSSIETFDVAKMSAHDIWHSILLKRNLNGGMLTRSILIAATNDSSCQPLWSGVTFQEKTVPLKKLQGSNFIQHFTPTHKIAWLRMKLFSIVASNRNTYAKIRVTFNGHTSLSLATSGAPELTDDLRCRISHLALDPTSARVLGVIFGSRDNLEKTDNKSLSHTALWNDLARLYVNNEVWQPYSAAIEGVNACDSIDVTVAPPSPGLDGATVSDVFLECRTDWTRLKQRVFCSTGCNSTGRQLLSDVWSNYVCGGRLKFQRNVVTMYVFTTWHAAGKSLPELCNRQLPPGQQLIIGVNAPVFQTPEKSTPPAGSSSSTKVRGRGNLQQPLSQIADVMNLLAKSVTTSSPREDINDDDAFFKKTESAKRALCVVEPNADLERYLTQHSIMKWWPDIYDKLGITSIEDLRFIGKVECERYLAGLPALPIMRLAWLADSKPSITDSTKPTI